MKEATMQGSWHVLKAQHEASISSYSTIETGPSIEQLSTNPRIAVATRRDRGVDQMQMNEITQEHFKLTSYSARSQSSRCNHHVHQEGALVPTPRRVADIGSIDMAGRTPPTSEPFKSTKHACSCGKIIPFVQHSDDAVAWRDDSGCKRSSSPVATDCGEPRESVFDRLYNHRFQQEKKLRKLVVDVAKEKDRELTFSPSINSPRKDRSDERKNNLEMARNAYLIGNLCIECFDRIEKDVGVARESTGKVEAKASKQGGVAGNALSIDLEYFPSEIEAAPQVTPSPISSREKYLRPSEGSCPSHGKASPSFQRLDVARTGTTRSSSISSFEEEQTDVIDWSGVTYSPGDDRRYPCAESHCGKETRDKEISCRDVWSLGRSHEYFDDESLVDLTSIAPSGSDLSAPISPARSDNTCDVAAKNIECPHPYGVTMDKTDLVPSYAERTHYIAPVSQHVTRARSFDLSPRRLLFDQSAPPLLPSLEQEESEDEDDFLLRPENHQLIQLISTGDASSQYSPLKDRVLLESDLQNERSKFRVLQTGDGVEVVILDPSSKNCIVFAPSAFKERGARTGSETNAFDAKATTSRHKRASSSNDSILRSLSALLHETSADLEGPRTAPACRTRGSSNGTFSFMDTLNDILPEPSGSLCRFGVDPFVEFLDHSKQTRIY